MTAEVIQIVVTAMILPALVWVNRSLHRLDKKMIVMALDLKYLSRDTQELKKRFK